MNCLVVGGAGFIGSHLVDALIKAGHSVRVFDNLSTGRMVNIQHHGRSLEFYQGDIRDAEQVREACRGIEVVFHEAAISSVVQSMRDPRTTHDINVTGTANILEAAGDAGVKHFIFASSAAVYGHHANPVKVETLETRPVSRYGLSKLVGEDLCRFYADFFEMQVTCLRYFNVYGPRQTAHSDYAGVISIFINTLLNGGNPTIYGDGGQTRDFINVKDIVEANLLAMQRSDYRFEIFNVGSGMQYSILELLENLRNITGATFEIDYQPDRRGDVRQSLSDIQKIRDRLGFYPILSFYDGLKQLTDYTRVQLISSQGLIQAGSVALPDKSSAVNA
jgi:UDP-glucose 4-epimerase